MTNIRPTDATGYLLQTRERRSQNDAELRGMLTAIKSDWRRELTNISLGSVWPHIERAVSALRDTDARRRDAAADALLDAVLKTVEATHKTLQACDAWERDHPG